MVRPDGRNFQRFGDLVIDPRDVVAVNGCEMLLTPGHRVRIEDESARLLADYLCVPAGAEAAPTV